MSDYKHGIYISEVPTSIVSPIVSEGALPVALVTAPVHLAKDPYGVTNVPKLCYTYAEAVNHFGFHLKDEIWDNYTAVQVIQSQFALYATAPVVLINVLDPKKHKKSVSSEKVNFENKHAVIEVDGVLLDTVKITRKKEEEEPAKTLVEGEDYTLSFDANGFVSVNLLTSSYDNMALDLNYDMLDPSAVTALDVIGKYDVDTGQSSGLELINEIVPRFRLVPGQIIAPGFSMQPEVAAVMETKAGNINGHFRCMAINDIPTTVKDNNKEKKLLYTEAANWVIENNYTSNRQINCYPKVKMGDKEYFLSTHMAGLICLTDADNDNKPFASPSNRNLKINGLCDAQGEEIILNVEQANYLNGQGIVTAINFAKGWTAWGNRTGIYPASSDVKDDFISVRRMFDWIGNSIALTYWSKIDLPMTRRNIYTMVDSINMWFNGLTAQEYILGGRIEFLDSDNEATSLMDGIVKFRVSVTPPSPMKEASFILEYDPSYLEALFS